MLKTIAIATTALALAGCATMDEGGDAASAIAAASVQFEAAFNAGDAPGLATLYTMDAAVMPPDAARVDGRAGIQALWQSFFDAGLTGLDLVTLEVFETGDSASEVGTLTLKAPDGQGGMVTVAAKYIVVWQKGEDGAWRLHRDTWNLDPAG